VKLRRLLLLPPADPGLAQGGWFFFASLFLFFFSQAFLAGWAGKGRPAVPLQVRLFCGVWLAASLPILAAGMGTREGWRALGIAPGKFRLRAVLGGAAIYSAGLVFWFPLFTAYFQLLHLLGVQRTPQPVYKWIAENPAGANPDLFLLLLVVFVLPFFEELAFRGLIQSWFRKVMPRGWALVGTAALFGLAHDPWIMKFPVFLLGLFFGYARERTGSLWASWAAHVLHNALVVVLAPYFIQFYD